MAYKYGLSADGKNHWNENGYNTAPAAKGGQGPKPSWNTRFDYKPSKQAPGTGTYRSMSGKQWGGDGLTVTGMNAKKPY